MSRLTKHINEDFPLGKKPKKSPSNRGELIVGGIGLWLIIIGLIFIASSNIVGLVMLTIGIAIFFCIWSGKKMANFLNHYDDKKAEKNHLPHSP